jgi:hypothetical protein
MKKKSNVKTKKTINSVSSLPRQITEQLEKRKNVVDKYLLLA